MALPALGLLVVPALWRAAPTTGTGARLDLLGAVLVARTASGLVLLVQSPASSAVVVTIGAVLLGLGVPAAAAHVRRRPEGFLPMVVVREPVVVRSALAASAVPAAWFALLIAVPAVLAARGWSPLHIGLALVPSALTGFLAPRLAGPLLVRLGPARSLVVSGATAAVALLVAAGGATAGSAPLLVSAVVLVTLAFGLGQPALMAAVGGAVPADVRGVALGIATLVFLVGGGIGSAVVGGLGELFGLDRSLLVLAALPIAGCLALRSTIRADRRFGDCRTFLGMASPFVELEVETPSGERTVKVTNPDKTYFSGLPEGRGRKLDLVEYYLSVGDGIVRALLERPTVLKRHPGGAETPPIYQKRVPDNRPPWMETVTVQFPSGRSATELCPVDVAHVAWSANTGCLDFHPWPSRRADVESPDELRIDLDPMPGTGWAEVQETALEVRAVFEELGMTAYPKTSGSKGIHVYVRIDPVHTFTEVRHAALAVGREVERRRPGLATARWWKEERGERVFLDYNRMARDQTIASAYSVRARPQATVSAPVTWDELPDCEIADFDIWTMRDRFAALGDVHTTIDDVHHDLAPLLELYERQGEGEAPYPPQFPKMEGEPLRSRPSVREPAAAKREAAARRRAEQERATKQ